MRLATIRAGSIRLGAFVAVACAGLAAGTGANAAGLDDMIGCWVSETFDATSLLSDASKADSAELLSEKMLLRFDRIEGTEHLVFGYIFEWDEPRSYVLGPTYENGAYNPAPVPIGGFLTFGFPEGGLDHVTQPGPDELLYVHTKSAAKSAMSVRALQRITCEEAETLERELLARQADLKG